MILPSPNPNPSSNLDPNFNSDNNTDSSDKKTVNKCNDNNHRQGNVVVVELENSRSCATSSSSALVLSRITRSRSNNNNRRWHRRSNTGTAVVAVLALLITTTAWLSLVFYGTTSTASVTTRFWHHFKDDWDRTRDGSPTQSIHYHHHSNIRAPPPPPPPPSSQVSPNRNNNDNTLWSQQHEELSLNHIVFGIAGSSQLWKRRKEFIRLWWRPNVMRGHVWLEEQPQCNDNDDASLPPIMISEDISRFRYTNPTGHPSGLRISRIVSECFRLGLPHVRWFVLGDDDTIFNPDNLVDVLNKYDSSEMVYVGSPSESHSANTYFSHSMAFGGAGIAISSPLAQAISTIQDDCLERYPKLYGSDDRLHACISELGVPLTRESGFHQWDIRGNAHGLLSAHPIAPFVSIHHVEAVDPFFPGLSSLDSLKLFTRAMTTDPKSFLQRSICYDHVRRLTVSVSLGYVVQVYPNIVLPRELERSEQTYSAWNRLSQRNEFDFDTRTGYKSVCKKPVIFFLKDIWKERNTTVGSYWRAKGSNGLKRRVFCFPQSPPLPRVQNIRVLGHPLSKNWHTVPRRLCCNVTPENDGFLTIIVRQFERGASNSVSGYVTTPTTSTTQPASQKEAPKQPSQAKTTSFPANCHSCGTYGHRSSECPSKQSTVATIEAEQDDEVIDRVTGCALLQLADYLEANSPPETTYDDCYDLSSQCPGFA